MHSQTAAREKTKPLLVALLVLLLATGFQGGSAALVSTGAGTDVGVARGDDTPHRVAQQGGIHRLHLPSVQRSSISQPLTPPDGAAFDVWYGVHQPFGQRGNPQPWVNIVGRVSSDHGITSLSYRLDGGAASGLSLGPDERRLARPGDWNIEIDRDDLRPGQNTVAITAVDGMGQETTTHVNVYYTPGVTAALPYAVNWAGAVSIPDVAQVVDGRWALEGDGVRTVETGYDRLIAIGDVTWTDYEVSVPVTIHNLGPTDLGYPSYGPGVGLIVRWTGHTDWDGSQPRIGYSSFGALAWYRYRGESFGYRLNMLGHGAVQIADDTSGRQLQTGVRYRFKVRVASRAGQTALYRFKVWVDGQPEPAGWDLEAAGISGEPGQGSVVLVAHHMDVSLGPVTVVPLMP